jgi:hypothetical protein
MKMPLTDRVTGSRYFINKSAGYKSMWNNSVANGVEYSAWELTNGSLIVLPSDKNTIDKSYNGTLPLKMNAKGKYTHVQFNSIWYPIHTQAHTHPDAGPSNNIGVGESDALLYNRLKNPLTILYNSTIYSAWTSKHGIWYWKKMGDL